VSHLFAIVAAVCQPATKSDNDIIKQKLKCDYYADYYEEGVEQLSNKNSPAYL
jgi:hypothetical protein